jgi:hypothetical protein
VSPALLAGVALMIAFYPPVWRTVYSAGIPRGLASTITQLIPLGLFAVFVILARSIGRLRDVVFFLMLSLGSGFGGAVGSILGNAGGATSLIIGALAGGILASVAIVRASARFGLIPGAVVTRASYAAVAGFLAASGVALSTLHSPVGPLVSTALVGAAGLWAVWHHREGSAAQCSSPH